MTIEEQILIPIDVSELVSHVEKMKKEGNRLSPDRVYRNRRRLRDQLLI